MKKHLFILIFLITSISAFAQSESTYESFAKYYDVKDFKSASVYLDTLLKAESKNNYWLLNKVEIESQNNHIDLANVYLKKLIDNGYYNIDELKNNQYLKNLRNTQTYNNLVNSLEAKLVKYKIDAKQQELLIDVPPMMECYTIMLYLSNPKHPLIFSKQTHIYFKNIDTYFEKYKTSKFIKELGTKYPGKEFINNLRAHHNLMSFYVYDSLAIDTIKRLPIEIDHDLVKLVHGFAVESDFMKFYQANTGFYKAMKTVLSSNYSFGSKIIPFFNENFDSKINRFNVYFSPIYGGWQYGPSAKIENYFEAFYFGGIMHTSREFYYPNVNLLFLLITEFDHSTVNAISDKYAEDFHRLKDKLTILNKQGDASYGSFYETINEYITWAFALQFFYEQTPREYSELEKFVVTDMQEGRQFVKFADFMELYKTYINNRKKYPKLKDFYPEIIKWVDTIH